MKKCLSVLGLCVCMALTVVAGEVPVNRGQLKQALTSHTGIGKLSIPDARESSFPLQQLMRKRHLTLKDNRLNGQEPRRESVGNLSGSEIAVFEAYDFDWDDENDVAIVNDSSCVVMGKYFVIKCLSPSQLCLSDFYGSYEIPIDIDSETGSVTLKAGIVLDDISENNGVSVSKKAGPDTIYNCWSLYVMPLQWLTSGSDECEDIHGQVEEDGIIVWNDDFAFLVENKVYSKDTDELLATSWGLSPIISGLVMLRPNGIHEYKKHQIFHDVHVDVPVEGGLGHTGYMPRPVRPRPGNTKPVSPRPVNSVIGSVNFTHEENTGIGVGVNQLNGGLDSIWSKDFAETAVKRPVYMCMSDDTTLVVYNLYDLDCFGSFETHFILCSDGSILFPAQALTWTDAGRIEYSHDIMCALTLDGITWGKTQLYYKGSGDNSFMVGYYYSSNSLYFSDDASFWVSPVPTFAEPVVTDSDVEFSATTSALDGVVELYVYDEELDQYFFVDNPYIASRESEPYLIYLAAITYFEATDECSEPAFLTYMVPALETFMLGDVNRDKTIDVSDVTILIGHILDNDFEDSDTFCAQAADCNPDGAIDVSDVTALIGYVLTGLWSHEM